jgi:hypothetical protein
MLNRRSFERTTLLTLSYLNAPENHPKTTGGVADGPTIMWITESTWKAQEWSPKALARSSVGGFRESSSGACLVDAERQKGTPAASHTRIGHRRAPCIPGPRLNGLTGLSMSGECDPANKLRKHTSEGMPSLKT